MCRFLIDLKAILDNFNKAKKKLGSGVEICVVVKANAYGFGAEKIAKLLEMQADCFAVARMSEFLKLKEYKIKKPVLILSPLLKNDMKIAIKNGAEITIASIESLLFALSYAKEQNTVAKVHLKVDSGMNRYGFKDLKEFKEALKLIKRSKYARLVGVYSHFADNAFDSAKSQFETFEAFKKIVLKSGLRPIFHMASSLALANKDYQLDMVRLGIDLYLSDRHSFETEILQIKTIKSGEKVSYGGTFVAENDMKIAVCGAGYADGVSRKLSSLGEVIVNGKKAEIIGRVCMDCFMIDINNVDAKVGDKVLIFGKMQENFISVCDVAKKCDTIPYEIYTGISARVKRVYHWGQYAGNFRKIQGQKAYKP
ncbi:MAG: alanine racemase [Clostridia bacterium]|nr:alanine racemase [Clostridia bacterium]